VTRQQLSLTALARAGFVGLSSVRDGLDELADRTGLDPETLGEQVFNYVLLNKRKEWAEYRAQVTPYELLTNLEIL
jgi:glutamine synthetase